MQLSKLEDAKSKGKVNLDFLKRKNKVTQEESPTQAQITPQPVSMPLMVSKK